MVNGIKPQKTLRIFHHIALSFHENSFSEQKKNKVATIIEHGKAIGGTSSRRTYEGAAVD